MFECPLHRLRLPNFFTVFKCKGCASLCLVQPHIHIKTATDTSQIANELFDEIYPPNGNAIIWGWNNMIREYVGNGQFQEAIKVYRKMLSQTIPCKQSFMFLVKACGGVGALEEGKQIHSHILKCGLHCDVFLGTCVVDMYAKLGRIEIAFSVFDKMPQRDVVSWTSIIGGCARNGNPEQALALCHQMQKTQTKPNHVTILSILSACADLGDLQLGKNSHSCLISNGLKLDDSVGSALVAMYAKCGKVDLAFEIFKSLPRRDAVLWNAMIAGYSQSGYDDEALVLFHGMQLAGVEPDKVTMVSVLTACAHLKPLQQDMYGKCGRIEYARLLFDKMPRRDLVSWNTLISGYAQNGDPDKALAFFHKLTVEGMTPNLITVLSILSVCRDLKALQEGKNVHDYITNSGFDLDVSVITALVSMYAKCGDMKTACQLFDKMPKRDIVSWNAMIAGYFQNGHASETPTLFHQLQLAGLKPDPATMVTVLAACAQIGAFQHGKWTHAYIIRSGYEMDVCIGTSFIDMHAKCGNVEFSYHMFSNMCNKDVASWNAMIAAYGMNGRGENALALFSQMQQAGPMPDNITFICILSACSHSGLVDEGWQFFDCMSRDYYMAPRMEHYACIMDLLGRVGLLNEAHELILNMPLEPGTNVWGALLFACRTHCNIELAEHVAKFLLELDSKNYGAHILLSSIYATAKRWQDAAKVRMIIKDKGLEMNPGCSWIEIKDRVHVFFAEDKSYKQSEESYAMLDILG